MLSRHLYHDPLVSDWGRELRRMRRAVDQVFGDFLQKDPASQPQEQQQQQQLTRDGQHNEGRLSRVLDWTPRFDIRETDGALLVDAELPGMSKEDIKVHVDGNNKLTVEGETRREEREDKEHWHYMERRFGRFHRSMILPENCDAEGIQARHENGILHLEIPKVEPQKSAKRTIDIQ